ncbi:hypothetical protein V8G54_010230 [Vigna mungo]|uniref:Uncharacterized protein n=1 Tax=Vigna mungo TaxID=3915 RepID=A0AAQ3NX63_VIGMU
MTEADKKVSLRDEELVELHAKNICLQGEQQQNAEHIAGLTQEIQLDHEEGFFKAIRQAAYFFGFNPTTVDFDLGMDVYKGKMVPLSEIPGEEDVAPATGVRVYPGGSDSFVKIHRSPPGDMKSKDGSVVPLWGYVVHCLSALFGRQCGSSGTRRSPPVDMIGRQWFQWNSPFIARSRVAVSSPLRRRRSPLDHAGETESCCSSAIAYSLPSDGDARSVSAFVVHAQVSSTYDRMVVPSTRNPKPKLDIVAAFTKSRRHCPYAADRQNLFPLVRRIRNGKEEEASSCTAIQNREQKVNLCLVISAEPGPSLFARKR